MATKETGLIVRTKSGSLKKSAVRKAVKKVTKKNTTSVESLATPRVSAQEKIWRAQDDARILAQAEDVKKDSKRLNAARAQAKKMAKDQEISLNSIKKIAEEGKQ